MSVVFSRFCSLDDCRVEIVLTRFGVRVACSTFTRVWIAEADSTRLSILVGVFRTEFEADRLSLFLVVCLFSSRSSSKGGMEGRGRVDAEEEHLRSVFFFFSCRSLTTRNLV